MRAALIIVLSLSALAYAGPAFNKNTNNQIDAGKSHHQQQQQYMTTGDLKQTPVTEILKQWCYSSQMSPTELTASFKKLVGVVKSSPEDQATEAAVMSERICNQAQSWNKSDKKDSETISADQVDAQAHELIKDVYMDALISCESRQCTKQLIKIINSNQVDTIRASYYMTRIAVTEQDSIKDNDQVKQLAESFVNQPSQPASEAIERQKLFAVTALIGKSLKDKTQRQSSDLEQTASQVAKTIVERYIQPVSQQEVQQYQQQQPQEQSPQVAKKIAKRNAALKALANIPGYVLKQNREVEQALSAIVENKQEMTTARQSAIECWEQCDAAYEQLKQLTFDQEEPIEVRVAALRALMTSVYAGQTNDEQNKQQMASEIVSQVVKHCENQSNQQQDDQFVLYATSFLNNLRTSQQPEHQAIKETIAKNKQHYMQIQLLTKKFQQQLQDIRKSSRNYKLEQKFNQIESGLVIEGDLIYESEQYASRQQQPKQSLPKLARFNMSMPVMGQTVNVVEVTVRQNQMDQEIMEALKLVQGAKFNTKSMSKVVDSFKSSVEQKQNSQQQSAEADLSIKIDGCTIVYLCVDDFKSGSSPSHQRNTRSIYSSNSIVDEIIEHLKRKPVAFNRGFNVNINERLAKVLDVDANVIAGLRFESRASGQSSDDFEIVAHVEPRFAFEAIVGPAKMSSKKLLQRLSTKTAVGLRLRYKSNELVDAQIDLPMNTMELFTFETQMVEKNSGSYTYLPESIYGAEDIYSPDEDDYSNSYYYDDNDESSAHKSGARYAKRSIFGNNKSRTSKSIAKFMKNRSKRSFVQSLETPEDVARATGLRGKLRAVASPKDMSFLVQATCQKYEPSMQGYRVQVQKSQHGAEQKQYVFAVSTPGSRVDRTMQVRLIEQSNSQRTTVKSEIQLPQMSATASCELIHDGRQYAIKAEVASSRGKQWRHAFTAGVQRASQSQPGRVASAYKPYMSVDSTSLRRPIQMEGVVSYQQSPKTVISYELKYPTGDATVQGKVILEERSSSYLSNSKRSTRRSMQSPIELLFQEDLTLTSEFVAKVSNHAVKVHNMIDWSPSKWAIQADVSASHKNLRKAQESQVLANLRVDAEQQVLSVQRKSPHQQRKEFQLTVASDFKSQNGHQFVAEYRYNSKRSSNAIVAYKHKVEVSKPNSKRYGVNYNVELISTEAQFNEKIYGSAQVGYERRMKTLKADMSSRNKQAKVNLEYQSFGEHQMELYLQSERYSHKASVRSNQNQYSLQSRFDERGQMLCKVVLEVLKQQGECQVVVEVPSKHSHYAADLKFAPGKTSSVAVQTPSFSSKAEFSFDTYARQFGANKRSQWSSPISALRFKGDAKNQMSQDAYWIDSAYNADSAKKSHLRFDSPIYRTDVEYDPREEYTKFGAFARSKRSISSALYSNDDSSYLSQIDAGNKLDLANKLWMVRSLVSSPSSINSLKQKARRALFEYADSRQSQKHSLNWSPRDDRLNFNLERQPSSTSSFSPMRFVGDFATSYQKRPSTLSMTSDYLDFDFDAQPYDGEEAYAKVSALSRHPRSPFSKHESELRYKKQHGYKAYMKHEDANQKRHSMELETSPSPKNWAKLSYDSDKHGKGHYEHKWRKEVSKRSPSKSSIDFDNDDEYYANQITCEAKSPYQQDWSHRSQFSWEEPRMLVQRRRRDISSADYSAIDYLKHLNARLNSQTYRNKNELYNLDFDYQPESHARLNLNMPNDMVHSSNFEYQPSQRLYKIQSRLYNKASQKPTYDFLATTKPASQISGLATSEQEAVFVGDEQHPMIGGSRRSAYNLFKQPLKLEYTDKYGRSANFDYDQSPITTTIYPGLRAKRAALYYKDSPMDFEHRSTYDFYPEAMFAFKPSSQRVAGDLLVKAETKYGPVAVSVDSDASAVQATLVSPVIKGKMSAEQVSSGKLIKFNFDNKQQTAKLSKIVRSTNLPLWSESKLIADALYRYDQSSFEHQGELYANLVEGIFKIKSQTENKHRPVLTVEAELNQSTDKAYVKINGERVKAQAVVDLISKSANLAVDVDNQRTIQHQTRLVRMSDKYYALESSTSYQQQPLFKLTGKVSSMIFSDPEHLFAKRSQYRSMAGEHVSSFEAVVYEPKRVEIKGQYDCLKKEAQIIFKDTEEKKISEVRVQYDDQAENVYVQARTSSPYGTTKKIEETINLTPLVNVY